MKIRPVFLNNKKTIFIAGPCSAETEEQVVNTARALSKYNIDLFRAGIWKPRTRPNSFEGVGSIGLTWLSRVQKQFNLKVAIEVAKSEHVAAALEHKIDAIWIGARTCASPFAVQEIASSLRGVDIPVLVKNPINPDIGLWIGAIERLAKAGVKRVCAIHRGFSCVNDNIYRNNPLWELPLNLKKEIPSVQIICDNSHICGNRTLLNDVARKAISLGFTGLMTEVHQDPDNAWSDAKQQITPDNFGLMQQEVKNLNVTELDFLEQFRTEIDEIDVNLLSLLNNRMNLVKKIGIETKEDNTILKQKRNNEIISTMLKTNKNLELNEQFIHSFFEFIYKESIYV